MLTKLNTDIQDAMRAKNQAQLNVLRQLKSALANASLQAGNINTELTESESISVVRKEIKKRQDSIALFEQGGRVELAAKEHAEILFLNNYLPQSLSDSEVDAIVNSVLSETGATTKKQMGLVMKMVLEKCAGRVENKVVVGKIQARLS